MLYSAKNAKLKVNDVEIIASNAELSLSTNLDPLYVASSRSSDNFVASNGIGGQLNFNYFLTGADFFKSFITGQGETEADTTVISGNFGGLNFDSGYLTSYSVNFSPNSPAVASASVKFFDELKGEFVSASSEPPASAEVLNFSNAVVSSEFGVDVVDNFVAGAFNYNADVSAAYLMNETKPSRVSFGVKTVNMNFEVDNPTGRLPVSGSNAKIEVGLKRFNNEDMPVTSWTQRNAPYNKYSTFDTDGSSITNAIKTNNAGECSNPADTNQTDCENNGGIWTPANYAIADSSSFVINDGEQFKVEFTLTLSDGSPPKIQLISDRLINDVGEAWSVAQTSVDGANSLAMAVYPVSEGTVIGTGNHGMVQIYNTSSQTAHWKLQDLKVTRTLTKPSEVFACSGVMQGRNIASAAGDYVKQTINIIQGKSDVVDIKVSYLIDADGNSEPITVPPFT